MVYSSIVSNKIVWFCILTGLAVLQIFTKRIDTVTLLLLGFAGLPMMWPYIRDNVSTIEVPTFLKILFLERKIRDQEAKIEQQQHIINQLVIYSMAHYLYEMLSEFYACDQGSKPEYNFTHNSTSNPLRYLRDHGYLERTFSIRDLKDGENIAQKVKLTPVGKFYVELRRDYEKTLKSPTNSAD